MSNSSMNIAELARYLHLTEAQAKKLIDRDEIPSRRIGGETVVFEDDVHRWWEKKIGLSDEVELVRVEAALDRSIPAGSTEESVTISGLIPEGAIAIPLAAKTKDSAIRSMVRLASGTGLLWDDAAMTEAVKAREELHSTAQEEGIALLHPRNPLPNILGDSFISLGILPSGIPFGGGFHSSTDIFFLICSMNDRIHLRILTRLSRMIRSEGFVDRLREAGDEQEVRQLIAEIEEGIVD